MSEVQEHLPITQDNPDVPKTRKAFVPLGMFGMGEMGTGLHSIKG